MPDKPYTAWVAPVLDQVSVLLRLAVLFLVAPYAIAAGGWQVGTLIAFVAVSLEMIAYHTQNDVIVLKLLAKDFEPNHFKEVPKLSFQTQHHWSGSAKGYQFHFLLASTTWTYYALWAIYTAVVAVAAHFHLVQPQGHWALMPLALFLMLVVFDHLRELRAEAAFYAAWAQNPQDPDQSPAAPAPYLPELRFTAQLASWYSLVAMGLAVVVAVWQHNWVELAGVAFLMLLMKLTLPLVVGCRNDLSLVRQTLFARHPQPEEGW